MRKYVRFGLIGHDPDSTMTARGTSNQQPGPGAGQKYQIELKPAHTMQQEPV